MSASEFEAPPEDGESPEQSLLATRARPNWAGPAAIVTFLSAIDTEVDGFANETFVLHPPGYDGPSRVDRAQS